MVKKALIMFVFTCFLSADNLTYTQKVKPVYLDGQSSKVIGKLMPTTALKVIEKSGDRVKFELNGYQNPSSKNVIYFIDGKRIISLAFAKTAKVDIKVEKEGKDGAWNEVSVLGYTDDSDFSDDLDGLYKSADETYKENCSICHSLHPVDHFNANQWPSLFNSMVSRTPIDKDEKWNIILYLQKHASDMKTTLGGENEDSNKSK